MFRATTKIVSENAIAEATIWVDLSETHRSTRSVHYVSCISLITSFKIDYLLGGWDWRTSITVSDKTLFQLIMRDLELASLGSPTIQHTQNLLNEYEISLSTLDVDTMNNRARIFHFISVILKHEPRLSQISPEIFRKLDINPAQQYSNPGPDPAVLNHYRAMKLLSPRTFFSNTHNNTSSNNSLRNQRSAITKSIWDLLGDLGVQPTDVKMGDIITESYVNQLFKKRALCVHPDKNPPEKKMNCESLFHAAKEAAQTLIQNYMHAPIPKFSPTCHLKTAFK